MSRDGCVVLFIKNSAVAFALAEVTCEEGGIPLARHRVALRPRGSLNSHKNKIKWNEIGERYEKKKVVVPVMEGMA